MGISGQSVEETENKRFDQFTIRSDAHERGARENSSICIIAFARHKPVASARRACTTYIQKKNYNCAKTLGT